MTGKLFRPDIFSVPDPSFSPTGTHIAAVVRTVGASSFGAHLAGIDQVEQFGGNEVNSNNFRVHAAGRRFLLKRFPSSANPDVLRRQLTLTQWLVARGAAVPPVLPDARGELLSLADGVMWCLMPFVEGSFFRGTEAETMSTAAGLARLQSMLGEAPRELSPPTRWEYLTAQDAAVFAAVRDRRDALEVLFGAEMAGTLSGSWARVAAAEEELWSRAPEILNAGRGASHCDLHPHNLLVHDASLRAVIDFESFATMPIAAALGYATYKLVRQFAVHHRIDESDARAIRSLASRFLDVVASGTGTAREELRLLALAELFRRVLVVFRLNTEGNTAWNHVLAMHLAGLDEIDVIFG